MNWNIIFLSLDDTVRTLWSLLNSGGSGLKEDIPKRSFNLVYWTSLHTNGGEWRNKNFISIFSRHWTWHDYREASSLFTVHNVSLRDHQYNIIYPVNYEFNPGLDTNVIPVHQTFRVSCFLLQNVKIKLKNNSIYRQIRKGTRIPL